MWALPKVGRRNLLRYGRFCTTVGHHRGEVLRASFYWKAKIALANESSGDAALRLLQRLCIPDQSKKAAMDAWAAQVKEDCSTFSGATIVALCEALAVTSFHCEGGDVSYSSESWKLPDPLLRRLAFELNEKRGDLEDGALIRAVSALERCGLKPGLIDIDLSDQPPQTVLASCVTATLGSASLYYCLVE